VPAAALLRMAPTGRKEVVKKLERNKKFIE
jgi:hypothetical protein